MTVEMYFFWLSLTQNDVKTTFTFYLKEYKYFCFLTDKSIFWTAKIF
jgi:hypothetical protein